ncbi:MAG: hypothetical protein QOF30_1244 [Acidimicrobiaceae bacterium]|nr:hypothetical protein [Acidimicrobiaceae bacterium]
MSDKPPPPPPPEKPPPPAADKVPSPRDSGWKAGAPPTDTTTNTKSPTPDNRTKSPGPDGGAPPGATTKSLSRDPGRQSESTAVSESPARTSSETNGGQGDSRQGGQPDQAAQADAAQTDGGSQTVDQPTDDGDQAGAGLQASGWEAGAPPGAMTKTPFREPVGQSESTAVSESPKVDNPQGAATRDSGWKAGAPADGAKNDTSVGTDDGSTNRPGAGDTRSQSSPDAGSPAHSTAPDNRRDGEGSAPGNRTGSDRNVGPVKVDDGENQTEGTEARKGEKGEPETKQEKEQEKEKETKREKESADVKPEEVPKDEGAEPAAQPEQQEHEEQTKERKRPVEKQESPIWRDLKPYRGELKTNDKPGKDKRVYRWDHTHNDIETYDRRGKHLGDIDPVTGKPTKPAKEGRVNRDVR